MLIEKYHWICSFCEKGYCPTLKDASFCLMYIVSFSFSQLSLKFFIFHFFLLAELFPPTEDIIVTHVYTRTHTHTHTCKLT